jgi:hypothetical protein
MPASLISDGARKRCGSQRGIARDYGGRDAASDCVRQGGIHRDRCSMSGIAIITTFWSQRQASRQKAAESTRRNVLREQCGRFISEGQTLLARCFKESEPPANEETNDWAHRAEIFLLENLGSSYVTRFRNGAGLPMTANSIQSMPPS